MITNLFIFINTILFLAISMLHWYWAFGGTWAIESAIPDKFHERHFDEKNRIKTAIATIIVAIGLLVFSWITASNYFINSSPLAPKHVKLLTRIIGGIFVFRAIGDFNLLGLFKKKSTSKFAEKDSQIYVPLCLYLGISSILITIL